MSTCHVDMYLLFSAYHLYKMIRSRTFTDKIIPTHLFTSFP